MEVFRHLETDQFFIVRIFRHIYYTYNSYNTNTKINIYDINDVDLISLLENKTCPKNNLLNNFHSDLVEPFLS